MKITAQRRHNLLIHGLPLLLVAAVGSTAAYGVARASSHPSEACGYTEVKRGDGANTLTDRLGRSAGVLGVHNLTEARHAIDATGYDVGDGLTAQFAGSEMLPGTVQIVPENPCPPSTPQS